MSSRDAMETARLRAGIEQTRSQMSVTIDAIQEKLNPQHIADQVRHTVNEQVEHAKASVRDATIGKAEAFMRDAGDTMSDARYSAVETVRHNPIPAAMVAIGLGWLLMNRSSPRRERHDEYTQRRVYGGDQYQYRGDPYRGEMYYNANHPAYRGEAVAMYGAGNRQDEGAFAQGQRRVGDAMSEGQRRVGDAVSEGQRRAGEVADQAQYSAQQAASAVGDAAYRAQSAVSGAAQQAASTVGDMANRAQETAGAWAGRTVYAAGRAEDRFERTLYENPLAVGAVALAMGVAAGFALPPTERENQLMGEARDNLFHQAQDVAKDTVDKVQRVASEVVKEAEHTAVDKSRELGLTDR